jgi:hypothetical protein
MTRRDNELDDGRRGFVRAVTALPLITLASPARADTANSDDAEPKTVADTPRTFNPHQRATLAALSDWIIPEDERSVSASEAGVVEFLDDWLGHKGGNDLASIIGGLVWLDKTAIGTFGAVFVRGSVLEQQALIERIAWPGSTRPEDAPGEIFFSLLRDLVVGAFFSTEQGVRDLPFLGNRVLQEWKGCPDVESLIPTRSDGNSAGKA